RRCVRSRQVSAGRSLGVPSTSGATISRTRRARCSAPTVGKLQNTSPQPHAPSAALARTNTAGRSVMLPTAAATGRSMGARKTQHSTLAIVIGRLFHRDADVGGHLAPLRQFVADVLAERLRRAGVGGQAGFGQARLDSRVGLD